MRSASSSVRRWASSSPSSCQWSGSSSACAAAVTTVAERCTNASGRMQTVGAACWERCSSPPHWSSRECDTRTRSHDTAEAEYADSCSLGCFSCALVQKCMSHVYAGSNTRITVMAVRFVVMYSSVLVHAKCHCPHTHTRAHTQLWSYTNTVLHRSAPPHPPHSLLYLVKSYCR